MTPATSGPPSRSYQLVSSGLCVFAFAALAAAGWIYLSRSQSLAATPDTASNEGFALLTRSMQSDDSQEFSASVQSITFIGDKKVVSQSKIIRAPGHASIQWVSGPMQGAQAGFCNRWFWRQSSQGKVQPYAEVSEPDQQAQNRRLQLLRKNYQAVVVAQKQMEGRKVQELELKPRSAIAKGPARRFYIDTKTGLALKTQGFDSNLNPVFETSLQKVNFSPDISATTFGQTSVVLAAAKKSKWQSEELGSDYAAISKKIGFLPPKSTYLPAGFELDGYGLHRCDTPEGQIEVASFARYSDGLNSLTVFAMKPCPDDKKSGTGEEEPCDFGAGVLASREIKQGRLIAVADLPEVELQKVLDASSWREKAAGK